MNMTKITIDQLCDLLDEMTIIQEIDGPGSAPIAHHGNHPTHGELWLVSSDNDAIMIKEGVTFL